MISRSNVNKDTKESMKIFKLILYLILYIHFLGCLLWFILQSGQGTRYYPSFKNGKYVSGDNEVFKDENGYSLSIDPAYSMRFGKTPTFRDRSWRRYEEKDGLTWHADNERWDSRVTLWTSPIDWINYLDHELGKDSEKYSTLFRYLTVTYYGMLNLGINEIGPVNENEFYFGILTLTMSAMLNAILFSDLAGLILAISQRSSEQQQRLDNANKIMAAIELNEGEQEEIRLFLHMT